MMSGENEQRFSEAVLTMLRNAGWYPQRDVAEVLKVPEEFALFPAAYKILNEFAYLHVGNPGPGIERARSTIEFDPMLAWGEADRFADYTNLLERNLYPLGEVDGGYYFLAVDETGNIFLIMDTCWFVDTTFESALDRLLMGKTLQVVDDQGHW